MVLCIFAARRLLAAAGPDLLRKINLDPLRTLAYVPRHAWPQLVFGRAGSTNRDCLAGSASGAHASTAGLCGPPGDDAGMEAGGLPVATVARGTAHKEVCRTVQSLPKSAASAAPLGPVVFGGFFMRSSWFLSESEKCAARANWQANAESSNI